MERGPRRAAGRHPLPRVLDGGVTHDLSLRLADMTFSSEAARLQRGLGWLTLGDLGARVRQGAMAGCSWATNCSPIPARARTRPSAPASWCRCATRGSRHPAAGGRGAGQEPHRVRAPVQTAPVGGLRGPAVELGRRAARAGRGNGRPERRAARRAAGRLLPQRLALDRGRRRRRARRRRAGARQRRRAAGAAALARHRPAAAPRPGDLVRLAGVDWLPLAWQPRAEVVALHTYTPEAAASAGDADDLFGDSALPSLALVGTSFSRTSEFLPQLSRDLGVAVGNFARDGGKFGGAAQAYFKSPAWKQSPPRLLIWEMDERDLGAPLAAEDRVGF
ncbi:cell division protein FtsQ [Achromobacter insuavis]